MKEKKKLTKEEKIQKKKKSQEESKKITIHQVIWYFLIFSVIGLILETIYGYVTCGVLESRKGLILGPVCPIYGVGAVAIILMLKNFKGKKITLLFLGAILGDVVEYTLSFLLEALYGSRFWDYSYATFQLNGRICLIYTVFWAILSLTLIEYVRPGIDKIINRIKGKTRKIIDGSIIGLLVIDCIVTVWGINVYKDRVMKQSQGIEISNHSMIEKIQNTIFSNDIMSSIFPNLRYRDKNGNEIWIKTMIPEE